MNNDIKKIIKKELIFKKFTTEKCRVFNGDTMLLGEIQRRRIGRHMHWVFCPVSVSQIGELWFTNSILKEITEKIANLYMVGRAE